MPTVARIESSLGFNDVAFTQGIERAEKRAQTFAGRVETTFQGLFRRTPGRRAEKALGGLLGDIATGNLTQGIAQFAGRLTGLGLAAGVGVGAAVELFDHLHDSVIEVRNAHDQLDKAMSKPLKLTSIEGLGAAIDNLQQKQETFTHGFTNYLYDIAHQKGAAGLVDLGKAGIAEQEELTNAIEKRHAAERLRGRDELIRANVLAGLEKDPKRKALAELRFKFDERRNAIMASPDKGSQDRLKALDVEQDAAEKRFKLEKEGSEIKLETEEKLAQLVKGGLKPEDQRKVRAGLELENINQELANETDPGKRRILSLEKLNKENELRSFHKPAEGENPFAWGTLSARDWESQHGNSFNSIAARDQENFGVLNQTQEQRDMKPKGETQSRDVIKETKRVGDLIEKYWGEGGNTGT